MLDEKKCSNFSHFALVEFVNHNKLCMIFFFKKGPVPAKYCVWDALYCSVLKLSPEGVNKVGGNESLVRFKSKDNSAS